MKKTIISRILSLLLVLCLTGSLVVTAFAATADTAIIDTTKTGSIEINKYDMTAATADGVFSRGSFVVTGTVNNDAESVLAPYAIEGVVFSYIKIADITEYTVQTEDGYTSLVLYAFEKGSATTQLLTALGLTAEDAYAEDADALYFNSDALAAALTAKLRANSSNMKDTLGAFVEAQGGSKMPATSKEGKTSVDGLELGLYLVLESGVPADVSRTTAPFFVSVPTTTVDGTQWNYDVVLYPKNETDEPTLEKSVRESSEDTGKLNDAGDGYSDTATGSIGDVVDYQIISTLPAITSNATALTAYSFTDTISKGITYNKGTVKLEWYKDAGCTEQIAAWTEADNKFSVTYGTGTDDTAIMTIAMTDAGLDEINNATTVYGADAQFRGYSGCTMRITYSCTVNADAVCGDDGDLNSVTLTWKRTSTDPHHMSETDCHFYTYGVELTKEFSDGKGNFSNVSFVIWNETDGYWVIAEKDAATGIYYVTDHADATDGKSKEEAGKQATALVPNKDGKVIVKGLEDDVYWITETKTDDGYVLLKDTIKVEIVVSGAEAFCDTCGAKKLTASATVNGKPATMVKDDSSANAMVALTVVNNPMTDSPATGDTAMMGLTIFGTLAVVSGLGIIVLVCLKSRKKRL